METSNFEKLASIDVSAKTEKKNGLTYLSWAWAVDQLLRADPSANWSYNEPVSFGETMMVSCTVTAFGVPRTCHLPVMDHRNKAIAKPDAFQVNTAMQRCLVKAIALHGLGLYIYAGEDVPQATNDADSQTHEAKPNTAKQTALDEFEKLSPVDKDAICASAKAVIDAHSRGAWVDVKSYDAHVKQGGADWYLAYWSQLPSNVRTFLKDQSKKAA